MVEERRGECQKNAHSENSAVSRLRRVKSQRNENSERERERVRMLRSASRLDDCAKDGGNEFFTKMYCVLTTNPYRFYRNSIKEHNASW